MSIEALIKTGKRRDEINITELGYAAYDALSEIEELVSLIQKSTLRHALDCELFRYKDCDCGLARIIEIAWR